MAVQAAKQPGLPSALLTDHDKRPQPSPGARSVRWDSLTLGTARSGPLTLIPSLAPSCRYGMMELFHRSMNQVRKSSMPMGQDRKKQGPAERHEAVKVAEDGLCVSPQQAEGSDNHGDGDIQVRQMVGSPLNKVREWGKL